MTLSAHLVSTQEITAQRKPRQRGAEFREETVEADAVSIDEHHDTERLRRVRDVMAITKMRFLGRAAPTRTCGMTDGIVRCTSMQRPRRAP